MEKQPYQLTLNGDGQKYINRKGSTAGGVVEAESDTSYIIGCWQNISRPSYWNHQIFNREIPKDKVEVRLPPKRRMRKEKK